MAVDVVFTHWAPAPILRPFVVEYAFVQALQGQVTGYEGQSYPWPGALLAFHFADPTKLADGTVFSEAVFLGAHTRARGWVLPAECYSLLVMLTAQGVARLFPATCGEPDSAILDLEAVVGGRVGRMLKAELSGAWKAHRIAACLDQWFMQRLQHVACPAEFPYLASALDTLQTGSTVECAAISAGVSRRQLQRCFRTHLGAAPKEVMSLLRLQASLRAMHYRQGDPFSGYSDQAHQVRSFRRYLGMTPEGCRRGEQTLPAAYLDSCRRVASQPFFISLRKPSVVASAIAPWRICGRGQGADAPPGATRSRLGTSQQLKDKQDLKHRDCYELVEHSARSLEPQSDTGAARVDARDFMKRFEEECLQLAQPAKAGGVGGG